MADKKSPFFEKMEKIIAREFPKLLRQQDRAGRERKRVLKKFEGLSQQLANEKRVEKMKIEDPPSHPWRQCPAGHSWVRLHARRIRPSKKNPNGITMVDGHCRVNRGKKELIFLDEINRIAEREFRDLKNMPCPSDLGYKKKSQNGSQFDIHIAGWTQYWNEVFKPGEPLTPNLVKALIASESGFNPKVLTAVPGQKGIKARGLMQITDRTLKILNDEKGELKNHFVKLSKEQVLDPHANIYAGIRWLFHKKRLATSKLGREATWLEAIAHFKGALKEYTKNPKSVPGDMSIFLERKMRVDECKPS
jgi:hypothetical protein